MITTILSYMYAVQPVPLGGEIKGQGELGLVGKNPGDIPFFLGEVVSKIIGVLTVFAIIWFVIQFILGAYAWISSSGDNKALEAARNRIVQSIIGLVVVITALVITSFIGGLLGLEILNIGQVISNLGPSTTRP